MNEYILNDLSDMLSNVSKSNKTANQYSKNNTEHNNTSFDIPNIDMETMLRMKNIMNSINNSKNNPSSNLLYSLKPFLNKTRKEKIDQYVQFMNMTSILDAFNKAGGINNG